VSNLLNFCILLSLGAIGKSFASMQHLQMRVVTFKEAVSRARASCGIDARAFHLYGEQAFEFYKASKKSGLIADEVAVNCLATTSCKHKNAAVSAEKSWYRATSICKEMNDHGSSAAFTTESTGEEDFIGESEASMEENDLLQAQDSDALLLRVSDIKVFTFGFVLGGIVFFAVLKGREQLSLQFTPTPLRRRPEL